MITILTTVVLASLVGSPHCAGMCGGFAALYSSHRASASAAHIAYNVGRLFAYLSLGALAGAFGKAANRFAATLGVQHAAAIVLAVILVVWGVSLWRSGGVLPHLSADSKAARAYRAVFDRAAKTRPAILAATIGLLSALLPCGWLYLYVAVAAGSGSPVLGALTMFAFWIGTLPMMLALGALTSRLTEPMKKYLPKISAAMLIAGALLSFDRHTGLSGWILADSGSHCSEIHSVAP